LHTSGDRFVGNEEREMGFNTTVVVLNDALGDIADDPEFGKALAQAIMGHSVHGPTRVRAGLHGTAATVVETHHGDRTVAIAVGGNSASVLGSIGTWEHDEPEVQIKLLKILAEDRGYKLIRAPGTKGKTKG
jgi:hypothetical protein